ncbi:hypothetical protein QBC47DRAFT_402173 [Echria macrotheca]|uniref:Glycoside hydrolase n=1 Tax=Echria macrotheca TaxID=438768 RepID=A0AAJ0BCY2_9PEZI|nr:hypothetical protein QBC47DRAFT_402173 [Echria macrotheca]
MAAQLPSGALGAAVTILVWSFLCLFVSAFLVLLVWVHGERQSYVALLGASLTLSVLASIIQQAHTISKWNDIKTAQWENVVANVGNPELNITGASTGLDLVVFYIQYYTYNVESLLVVFWSVELASSVFQIRSTFGHRYHISIIAKATAVLLPVLQQILLRSSFTQHSTLPYMFLADFLMISSFGIGCIVLIGILVKYIHARISLVSWNVTYGQRSGGTSSASGLQSGANGRMPRRPRMKAIYDRWLLIRFSIAFLALGVFELVVINFQLRAASTNTKENIPPVPDLSAERAISDFILFLPGVCAGPLTFIVFGTTRTFRQYMIRLFLPKVLQEKLHERRERRKKPSTVGTPGSGFPRYPDPAGGGGSNNTDVEAANGNADSYGTHNGAVRMQDFGRDNRQSEEWANARRDDDDELPIMKPPLSRFHASALRSNPP